MVATQADKQGARQKAHRLNPTDELTSEDYESIDEDRAALIRSGRVQFWRINGTVGIFSESVLSGVWQLTIHFADPQCEGLDEELKLVVRSFWEAEDPEYVTANCVVNWPNTWLMQSAGFHQNGVLPLSSGPVASWGWRKSH